MTFRRCAEVYIAAQSAGWRSPKSLKAWEGTLAAYVYPIFGELPVAAVDIDIVTKALDPIWSTKPETASRVRGRIEAILDLTTVRKYRSGDNPGRWRGHLEQALLAPAKAKRAVRQSNGRAEQLAALPFAEMPAVMAELRGKNGVAARAMEFAITAARTDEVIGAPWSEIDLEGRTWVIPAERRKKQSGSIEYLSASLRRVSWRVWSVRDLGCSQSATWRC